PTYDPNAHFDVGSSTDDPGYRCDGSGECLLEDIQYDAWGRVRLKGYTSHGTTPEYGGTTEQAFKDDGLGRTIETTDNNGDGTGDDITISRSYDTLSRMLEESQRIGPTRTRTPTVILSGLVGATAGYDKNGSRTRLIYPSGLTLNFTQDALNRLAVIHEGDSTIAQYDYSGPSLVKKRSYGNGVNLTLSIGIDLGYDGAKRLTHLAYSSPASLELEYGYDSDSLKLYERRLNESAGGGNYKGQKYTYT